MNEAYFPIQSDETGPASSVPLWVAEKAYSHYKKLFGSQQSLEKIGRRGGFGREEILAYLAEKRP